MPYETFDDFARLGSPRLLGAARLLLGDRHIAEDLIQETLIRVYRSWSSIRVDAAIDSYAYRTLVRLDPDETGEFVQQGETRWFATKSSNR